MENVERQSDSKAARGALASAQAMTSAGRKRTVWPRWAAAVDAVFCGVLALPFMHVLVEAFVEGNWGLPPNSFLWSFTAIFVSGLWFRIHMHQQMGVLPKPRWSDAAWNLSYFVTYGLAVAAVKFLGWTWAPWPVAAATAVMHYFLRRQGRVV